MARRYGRSPRGQRAYAKVPFGHWKRLSVLSALGIEGFLATMSVEEATDAAIFAAYLEQVLLPVLRQRKPDAVLVMDNLRPHKTPEVQAVLDGSGFPYRYLPSYSPDLSPIEPGWAKVKSYLRRVAARTVETLQQGVHPAWLRFYTVRTPVSGRFRSRTAGRCVPIRFIACNHGVQSILHAMFPSEAPYCTP